MPRWTSSTPAAPISASPGCAPIASTDCLAASRAARPLAASDAAVACNCCGRTGLCRNSSAAARSGCTAGSSGSCAVITATGSAGASWRKAARSSRPVMPGNSASVSTRTQTSAPASCTATAGSGVCLTSNPPRLPSTCIAKWAATGSSSISRIRPGDPPCALSVMCPLPGYGGSSCSPAKPRAACRGDIADVDLLEDRLVPVIVRVERPQHPFIGTSRGRRVTHLVVGAAKSERRQRERSIGVESAPKRDRGPRWLACLERDEPLDEVRVGIERVVREERGDLCHGGVAITLARRIQCRSQPLLARLPRLAAERPPQWPPARPCPGGLSGPRGCPLQGVRGTEDEHAARAQGALQRHDHPADNRRVEVDEDIPAGDEVEA